MFERYTDRARRIIVLAQEEARSMGHAGADTGHLLLGMLAEGECVAAQALDALGATLPGARAVMRPLLPGHGVPVAHPEFTPRLKRAMDSGLREALHLGHSYIGTEHLLLGLERDAAGSAAQVLGALGIPLPAVRGKVTELLRGYEAAEDKSGQDLRPATIRDVLRRLEALSERVAVIEQRLGIGEDAPDGG